MKNLKKLLGVFVFVMVMVLVPKNVFAQASYDISNKELDGNIDYSTASYEFDYAMFYIQQSGDFNYTLTTTDLDDSKNYTVSMKSDFLNESHDYTGSQLNAGVDLSITDAKSYVTLTIVEKGTTNIVQYKDTAECYGVDCTSKTYYVDEVVFMFSEEIDTTELDAFYEETFKDGKAKVDTVKISGDSYKLNSAVTVALSKYETERFNIEDETYDSDDPTMLQIIDTTKKFHFKSYPITYEFATVDADKKKKVDEVIKQFDESFEKLEEKWFVIEDLENINFKYATMNITNEEKTINMAVNYSSKLHDLLGNTNMTVAADIRMGWDSKITAGTGGYLEILYDGVIYAVVDSQGTIQRNVIYVPDGTAKNRSAYINAAKERIKKYLPNVNVEITYAGQIDDLTYDDLGLETEEIEEILDVDKTLGEYYTLTLDGKNFTFFIAEGSKNMNEPFLRTKDLNTSIYVETESSQAPLDSTISTKILDKDSEEYKNLMSKLNITDGISADIKLFSKSQNTYVSKLSNGKFKVYIPVDKTYEGKKLVAYYVKEDGTIEEHEVTIKDGYASFETDHFSVYTLAAKEEETKEETKTETKEVTTTSETKTTTKDTTTTKNPKTSDNILTYVITLIVSLVGITFIVLYLRRIKILKNS